MFIDSPPKSRSEGRLSMNARSVTVSAAVSASAPAPADWSAPPEAELPDESSQAAAEHTDSVMIRIMAKRVMKVRRVRSQRLYSTMVMILTR